MPVTGLFLADAELTSNRFLWRGGNSEATASTLFSSIDGDTWASDLSLPSSTYVFGITYSNNVWMVSIQDGYLLRAVGDGTLSVIFRDDEINSANSTQYVPITSLASNGGGTWVATDQYGRIFRSTNDGASWTRVRKDDYESAERVIWTGSQFVTFIYNFFLYPSVSYYTLWSSDGNSWTEIDHYPAWAAPADTSAWHLPMAYGNSTLVLGRNSSNTSANKLAYSTDGGTTWTVVSTPFTSTSHPLAIDYGNNLFVAAGTTGKIATSPDGITWTSRSSPAGPTESLSAVVYSHKWFVSGDSNVYVSDDGIAWHTTTTALTGTPLIAGSLRGVITATFTADAVLFKPTAAHTFTANALIDQGHFIAAATLHKATTLSFLADAAVAFSRPIDGGGNANTLARNRHDRSDSHFGIFPATKVSHDDSTLLEEAIRSLWARIVAQEGAGATALVLKQTGSALLDAITRRAQAGSATASSLLRRLSSGSFTADGFISIPAVLGSFVADAISRATRSTSLTADAVTKRTSSTSLTADSIFNIRVAGSFTADAFNKKVSVISFTGNSVLFKTISGSFTADAKIGNETGLLGDYTLGQHELGGG